MKTILGKIEERQPSFAKVASGTVTEHFLPSFQMDSYIRSALIDLTGAKNPHRGGFMDRIGTEFDNICQMIPMLMLTGFLTFCLFFGIVKEITGGILDTPSIGFVLVISLTYAVIAHVILMEIMYPKKDETRENT